MQPTIQSERYLLIGHPVGHLRVADQFNAGLEDRGANGRMTVRDIAPEDLAGFTDAARGMIGLRGFLVSRPHKQTILPFLDRLTRDAEAAGLANIVRRETDGSLTGHQLDGPGFLAGMHANGFEPSGKRIFIQGAGGVAAAIGYALAEAGAREILIANRTPERAKALAHRLGRIFAESCSFRIVAGPPKEVDAAINATSLGTAADDRLPFDPASLGPDVHIADVVNLAGATALENAARRAGQTFQPGRDAVLPQYALMHAFFGAS